MQTIPRTGCQLSPCYCHDDGVWENPRVLVNGCASCGCHRASDPPAIKAAPVRRPPRPFVRPCVALEVSEAEGIADELQTWAAALADMAEDPRLSLMDREAARKSAPQVAAMAERLYQRLPADLGY